MMPLKEIRNLAFMLQGEYHELHLAICSCIVDPTEEKLKHISLKLEQIHEASKKLWIK